MSRSFFLVSLLALSAVSCGGDDDGASVDAGLDAGVDAGRDAGPPDAGPMCTPSCGLGQGCCWAEEGTACVPLATDLHNCGVCGLDCALTGRGDSCQAAQCACGDFRLGCVGSIGSTCCVPPEGTGGPTCADLARSREHCGTCNNACVLEQANRCDGARCVCGDERRACAGTDVDQCCGDRFEVFACVDVTSDREHCGTCGNRCGAGFRCDAGTCVPL